MWKIKIIRSEYSEIMQKSFIDYAMSVIVARALPDIRDGLNLFREEHCTICMNWESGMTDHIERVHVSLVIRWVNIIRMGIVPYMIVWWSWHRISKNSSKWLTDMVTLAQLKAMELPPCDIRKQDWQRLHRKISWDLDKDVVDFVPEF